jgi:hypothetical protein
MGVDHDAELVVGFELDTEKVEKWSLKNNIHDPGEIDTFLQKIFKEIPEKNHLYRSTTVSIYVRKYGDSYYSNGEYFLAFYTSRSLKIKDVNNITDELLVLAKKVYKEIIGEELECPTVSDIPIFSNIYIW